MPDRRRLSDEHTDGRCPSREHTEDGPAGLSSTPPPHAAAARLLSIAAHPFVLVP